MRDYETAQEDIEIRQMSDIYKSKTIQIRSSSNTLIYIHVLDNQDEIMGFVNNYQNIKYQIKVDVK